MAVSASIACMPRVRPIDTGQSLRDADLALAFSRGSNADADDFSEQLVVRAVIDDGMYVYAKLTVTNLATADGRADLTVNVTLADGRQLRFKERRDRDEWALARDRLFAEVGAGSVEVGVGRARVIAKNDEFEIDLEISSALPPLRPRGGIFDRGGRSYVTTIPIPRGAAKAHLKVLRVPSGPVPEDGPEGDAPAPEHPTAPEQTPAPDAPPDESLLGQHELVGIGYAEHRAGNVAPYALARRWYSIIDIGPDRTLMLSVFENAPGDGAPPDPAAKPGPVQGFLYAAGDDEMEFYEPQIDLRVRGWRIDDQTHYPIPEIVMVHGVGLSSFKGVIVPGALSRRKDDLEGLSKIERFVVRKFMKPWTFAFERARFLFRKQEGGGPMSEMRGLGLLQVQQLN